jgi:hypothetical protein
LSLSEREEVPGFPQLLYTYPQKQPGFQHSPQKGYKKPTPLMLFLSNGVGLFDPTDAVFLPQFCRELEEAEASETSRTIISAAWLRLLPGVHLLPIDQMFFLGS